MDEPNKRTDGRQPVLKAAKVRFNQSVVDCLVLDLSPGGMRVSTEGFVAFPETVQVELRTGGLWRAERRWQRGLETGFALVAFAGLSGEAAAAASRLYDAVRNDGLREVTARLAAERYYDHPDLPRLCQAATAAVHALEEALRVASGRS